jgi:hypothetical protein
MPGRLKQRDVKFFVLLGNIWPIGISISGFLFKKVGGSVAGQHERDYIVHYFPGGTANTVYNKL